MAVRFRLAEELGDQMTQAELARQADVAVATVNRMCTNFTAQVSLETLDKISRVLGCPAGDLLEQEPERKKSGKRRRKKGST